MQKIPLTFKTLVKKIDDIAKEYFASKNELNSKGVLLDPNLINDDSPYQKYIVKVNDAYSTLNDIEKAIINNDFFYQNYPLWWKSSFRRSTYYRYKNKAMIHFVEAFEK